MKIIIDTLGSDLGYEEVVKGVIEASKVSQSTFVLVGPQDKIQEKIREANLDSNRFEYVDTNVFITNEDEPVKAIRKMKDSSTVLGLNKLNEEGYDGFISAGSTGALLAGGLFITKRIDNVERAVITAALPTRKGPTILVDTGAVMDSTSLMQQQFAIMGSIYANKVLNRPDPKVYLLNVGAEEGKGDMRAKKTYELLKETKHINFCGNIEARDFISGFADVIVADGFAGNVGLKSIEGVAGLLFKEIKEGAMTKLRYKIGALLMKPVFKDIASMYDYKEVGAAMLLGIKKPVFKAHGSSNEVAIKNAILNSEKIIKTKIIDDIEEEFVNG
ncbi:MAG: phosphate acyltransferase PlsX [Tissierellia bacterium]|nr:phosphate acyltransferase PlsX [Tissierellia bacterium]